MIPFQSHPTVAASEMDQFLSDSAMNYRLRYGVQLTGSDSFKPSPKIAINLPVRFVSPFREEISLFLYFMLIQL